MTTNKHPHVALDAEIGRFEADGRPVWTPIIIERWDDGKTSYTKLSTACGSWKEAINTAHEALQSPNRPI